MTASRTATDDHRLLQKLAQNSVKVGRSVRNALYGKSALYEVFHENTKLSRWSTRAYWDWIGNFSRMRPGQTPLQGGKVYTLMERRELPPVTARNDLEHAITTRRSVRTFSGEPLAVEDVSRLLFFAYGKTSPRAPFRAVASGGALYPLELYVIALNVDGLDRGIYHYAAETGHLDIVRTDDGLATLKDVVYVLGIDVDHAALAIVVTAAFRRSTIKYLDRGYRMILMEAGEVAQNLSLVATSMHLGTCLLGGFNDDLLSEFLDIDGVEEAPLLAAVVGHPAAAKASSSSPTAEQTPGV